MEIHYLMASECGGHLKLVIDGINSMIESIESTYKETNGTEFGDDSKLGYIGCAIDLNFELESLYGLALIAMQNYISAVSLECYIISNNAQGIRIISIENKDNGLKRFKEFTKELRKKGNIVQNSQFSEIQLIWALANAYKHRPEEFGLILNNVLHDECWLMDMQTKSYKSDTKDILTSLNLLTPFDGDPEFNYCEWEIYPVLKGMRILGGDLLEVVKRLHEWEKEQKLNSHYMTK